MARKTRAASRSDASPEAVRRYLDRARKRVDRALDVVLPPSRRHPSVVHRAMRYSALAPGKRLRPAMVLLAYEACGGRSRRVDDVAAALEMVHAFSLVHDDLPAMDDDDVRRGKPSCHVAFGEGIAILAGDALLTHAFGVLGRLSSVPSLGPGVASRLVTELSEATGTDGVIGGQVMDLLSEGRSVRRSTVDYIHAHKTARLFSAALRLGGIAAGASPARMRSMTRYGEHLGVAFQIVDDILGSVGSYAELGREPGRDRERGKATYPRIHGLPGSHREVDRRLGLARRSLRTLPERTEVFRGLLDLVDARRRAATGKPLGPGVETSESSPRPGRGKKGGHPR